MFQAFSRARKVADIRQLAERLREYASEDRFGAYSERMALVAAELDDHADRLEAVARSARAIG